MEATAREREHEDGAVGARAGKDEVQETAEEPEEGVRAVTRPDPILPGVLVEGMAEHPAREAGRLAFGGLLDGREDLAEAQLPLFDRPKEGPRVAMLELADARGGTGYGPRPRSTPGPAAVRGCLCHDAARRERDTGATGDERPGTERLLASPTDGRKNGTGL